MRLLYPHDTSLSESLLTCLHPSLQMWPFFVTAASGLADFKAPSARPEARSQGRLQCQLPRVLVFFPKCLSLTNLSSGSPTVALPTHRS